jgi:mannose-6-phosphate isomerase
VQRIYSLKGKVQHYSWGGLEFIPHLLQTENGQNIPFAEYWLGAHPAFSSTINFKGKELLLIDFIDQNRELILGTDVAREFGVLPFLFKVLDVRQMLSIQVHPSKTEAVKGFEKENVAGVSLSAPNRNYKDENHKPEAMVALDDFYLLHGFKPEKELLAILNKVSELSFLQPVFEAGGYKGLYQHVMGMNQEEVNKKLQALAERISPLYENGELQKMDEDFWAARAIKSFCKNGQYDKGIFSIYLFNLVHLKKGEGIYQPEGMPHAYLEGQNIELMANSDNVLRGGLTDKHVDVIELMKHTRFEATLPNILQATDEGLYQTTAKEFCLYKYEDDFTANKVTTDGPEIIFCLHGRLVLQMEKDSLSFSKGEAAFVFANTELKIERDNNSVIFRAAVPAV